MLYRYTVYTPQEQMKQIILEDTETRLNVLRHIFGVNKYRQIKNNLSIFLSYLKGETKLLQGEIGTLDKDKEELELKKEELIGTEKKKKELDRELTEKTELKQRRVSELRELSNKIEVRKKFDSEKEKTMILIKTKNETIASTKKELSELVQLIQQDDQPYSEQLHREISLSLSVTKEELDKLNSLYVNAISRSHFHESESKDLISKKERIFRIDICPTCLQDVSEVHKHNILNETEKKLTEIKLKRTPKSQKK